MERKTSKHYSWFLFINVLIFRQTKAPNDATSTMNQYHQHYYQQYQQYLASFYQQTGAYHQQPISIEQYYSQSHAAQSNQVSVCY